MPIHSPVPDGYTGCRSDVLRRISLFADGTSGSLGIREQIEQSLNIRSTIGRLWR